MKVRHFVCGGDESLQDAKARRSGQWLVSCRCGAEGNAVAQTRLGRLESGGWQGTGASAAAHSIRLPASTHCVSGLGKVREERGGTASTDSDEGSRVARGLEIRTTPAVGRIVSPVLDTVRDPDTGPRTLTVKKRPSGVP